MIRMRTANITTGGQVSIPAEVRRRWGSRRVVIEDQGDRLVLRPLPDDPIAAARGALKGEITVPTEKLRERARRDEEHGETRSTPKTESGADPRRVRARGADG
jgi:bifunctional DNA-binding transcriptional regulator/antitoxin component of YhaV-PrlF toxin-antitoxin module